MRKVQTIGVIAGLLFSLIASAENKQTPKAMNKIELLPRDLEIQLALSALPLHLRDNATVYVLNPDKGFEVARNGTNGFHAFVARTGDDAFRGSWPLREYRDDILYPISFDKAGAKAQMRIFFDAAEMQAKGTPPEELKNIIKDRYKTGYYKAPERVGISYMLSPVLRTYWNPEESDSVVTVNIPHVMYYAPNVSNEDIGGGKLGGLYPFIIMPGPHGYIIQLLGPTESAAITKEYEIMLARVCKIKEVWCLPKPEGGGKAAARSEAQQGMPDWVRRGIPGKEHAALEPLIGTWRQQKTVYGGTMGRGLDAPPIISDDITTRREWVDDGHYMEDLTEGKIDGKTYWRKGWLGYSIMDRRYEWVTIDSLNTTMMRYLGKPGSGGGMPIDMTGVFTDQGVVGERTVGKTVGQRTVIRIENNDRHVFELYFTPPGERELLVDRTVYTRIK